MIDETNIPVCRGCGYKLGGLSLSGTCPECGSEFDLSGRRPTGAEERVPPALNPVVVLLWFYLPAVTGVLVILMSFLIEMLAIDLETPSAAAAMLAMGFSLLWILSLSALPGCVLSVMYWFLFARRSWIFQRRSDPDVDRDTTGLWLKLVWYGVLSVAQWLYLVVLVLAVFW